MFIDEDRYMVAEDMRKWIISFIFSPFLRSLNPRDYTGCASTFQESHGVCYLQNSGRQWIRIGIHVRAEALKVVMQ
jgi:hypothetical protein